MLTANETRFVCPRCLSRLKIPRSHSLSSVECPSCHTGFALPASLAGLSEARAVETPAAHPLWREHGFSAVVVLLTAIGLVVGFLGWRPAVTISSPHDGRVSDALVFLVCGSRVVKDGAALEEPERSGSGFLVSADGLVLTNRHVVLDTWQAAKRGRSTPGTAPVCWAFIGNKKYEAEILSVSAAYDLAILRVPELEDAPFFRLARKEPSRSTSVHALGFPSVAARPLHESGLGLDVGAEAYYGSVNGRYSVTTGKVSSIDRGSVVWVQHDASIDSGSSGGPLLDDAGRVVGLNTQTLGEAGTISQALATGQLEETLRVVAPEALWD